MQWIRNGRSTALPQSLVPAALAAVLAMGDGFVWWLALVSVAGVAFAHLAMNLADDYFDYRVDMKGDRDKVVRKGFRAMTLKYPYLSDGTETPHTLLLAILQFLVAALACGVVVLVMRLHLSGFTGLFGAWWVVAITAATAFLGMFYSAPPLKLAYRGLGELVIGVIFGPLLMIGVYYSACGKVDTGIVFVSIPVGILVLNILFTHSVIDLPADAESNKMTFARVLGSSKANLAASMVFNFLPFAMIVAAVCLGSLSPAYLAVLVMLPRAVWLFRSLVAFSKGQIDVPEKPLWYLGPMSRWDEIRKAGVDWFMMRWFCARNLLSDFCLIFIIIKVALVFV